MTTGAGQTQLPTKKQRKRAARQAKAEQPKGFYADRNAAKPDEAPKATAYRSATEVNGETVVRREGGYDQQLSRLEYLLSKGVITSRQADAGAWLADRWQAYFTPGVSSGIEDHAPGSIPTDPFARWAKGQTGFSMRRGKVYRVSPPPTFRPRKPSECRFGHDGWSHKKLDALQSWIRANRLVQGLPDFDREVLTLVAVEGYSLEEAFKMITGSKSCGGKQRDQMKRALHRGLDAIADETEPAVRNLAA